MAISYRSLLCALLASFASAQVVSNSSSTAVSSGGVTSTSTIVSSSAAPPSTTPSVSSVISSSSTPPPSSTIPPSSTVVISSTSTVPPSSSSTATRASSTASSASPPPSSSASSAPPPPSSSSSVPPPTSTATSRSSAPSTSIAPSSSAAPPPTPSTQSSSARSRTESSSSKSESSVSSAYVFSSVSSSVVQSTVISTNAVIITTQGDNGQLTQRTSYTVVQTTVPATTLYATTVVTSSESPTGIAGLQAQAVGGSGGDSLSTGAKAGIGAGVAVLVMAAAIFGALFAMRRRRRNNNNNRIAENDRYPPSSNPSFFGVAAMGKRNSRFTESELYGSHSPPMREADPLDRYATPGMSASGRNTIPANSRTSDISSMSGSEPAAYRPGPGMPVVAEYSRNHGAPEELPEQHRYRSINSNSNNSYAPAAAYSDASGNPFHEKSGNQTPSLYSNDGDDAPHRYPSQRQASPAALELSGENTLVGSLSQSSGGYRGMDPEQPYHTRSQLTKPSLQQRQFDPSHNF